MAVVKNQSAFAGSARVSVFAGFAEHAARFALETFGIGSVLVKAFAAVVDASFWVGGRKGSGSFTLGATFFGAVQAVFGTVSADGGRTGLGVASEAFGARIYTFISQFGIFRRVVSII